MGGFTVALYGAKYPDKRLRGLITSGALTKDNGGLITGVPKDLDPHTLLPNELGAGVCSVAEVVDWYGKDPYNTKTLPQACATPSAAVSTGLTALSRTLPIRSSCFMEKKTVS